MSGCIDCGTIMDDARIDTIELCDWCYNTAIRILGSPEARIQQLAQAPPTSGVSS